MSAIRSDNVAEVLDALIGKTNAVGETYEDEERFKNVESFGAVCDWVFYALCNAEEDANRYEGSRIRQGRAVLQQAESLRDFFYEEYRVKYMYGNEDEE